MNKKLEWLIIIFMLVILVTLGSRDASADHGTPHQTDEEYQAEITQEMEAIDNELSDKGDSISNLQGVANGVVCVFAPEQCQENSVLTTPKENQ
jgi:peptidoglycan hydrolase CwlO-like protein